MSMIVNRRDIDFYFYDMFGLDRLLGHERYSDYDRETVEAVMDSAQQLAEELFYPFAQKLDANEPIFVDGKVEIIPEVKTALDAFSAAGFIAAGFDQESGGMQLPTMVNNAVSAMFTCANTAAASYAFLTSANARMLQACASPELIERFLPPMLEGRWFGTMCLSETQAGSSLADIKTSATPREDGGYSLVGSKMWISGGEQSISENIVHMVLARLPDAPPGVRGISLFLVPKIRVNADGSLGEWNHIALAGLNHKMGHRGTTNCLLNFGETGESIGYLVGEENQGLANMFHMMNDARIGVGLSAVMSALGGFLYSLDYATERLQGRKASAKSPELPQVPIIEHTDVKRLLMTQKVFVEGGQALIYYCSSLLDRKAVATSKEEAQRIDLLLELMTPVAKSWPSEYCLEANKLAIQVLGGYGYTRDYPVERLYRDNRLNHIHEGTHAIHGLDILGRKVRLANGAAMDLLHAEMQVTIDQALASEDLKPFAESLMAAWQKVRETVDIVVAADDKDLGLANATLFLDAFGHVVVGWLWLWQAIAVSNDQDDDFATGKRLACQFFYRYELPKAITELGLVAELDSTCMTLTAGQLSNQSQ
ncbi:MAG: acyl-CoA dehydrogenase [Woeseiaceae bacterium]